MPCWYFSSSPFIIVLFDIKRYGLYGHAICVVYFFATVCITENVHAIHGLCSLCFVDCICHLSEN